MESLSSHLLPSFIPLPVKAETLGFLSSGLVVEPLPPSSVYVGPPPDAGISFSVVGGVGKDRWGGREQRERECVCV